jgi:hypothetical protein
MEFYFPAPHNSNNILHMGSEIGLYLDRLLPPGRKEEKLRAFPPSSTDLITPSVTALMLVHAAK